MALHDMPPATDRAALLRTATHATHERLDHAIMAARPFDNLGNYGRFLKVQHRFHQDVAPLYSSAALADLFPDLNQRGRLAAVRQDAAAIGLSLPEYCDPPVTVGGVGFAQALGWLYVVEGSNLGAAFLLKAAQQMGLSPEHGASHLAQAPEGRAAHWRRFKAGLDAASLNEVELAQMIAGANAAFARVRSLVALYLP